jgi:hypothetical protein
MGKLVSWQINQKQLPHDCKKCGMVCKKGCCEDKYKFVKVDNDQKTVAASPEILKAPVMGIDYSCFGYSSSRSYKIVKEFFAIHAPPKKPRVQLYVSNCVFRI